MPWVAVSNSPVLSKISSFQLVLSIDTDPASLLYIIFSFESLMVQLPPVDGSCCNISEGYTACAVSVVFIRSLKQRSLMKDMEKCSSGCTAWSCQNISFSSNFFRCVPIFMNDQSCTHR